MKTSRDYPGREGYQSARKAEAYSRRSPARNRAEERLLAGLLARMTRRQPARALDIPSGEGRMARWLEKNGFETIGADLSFEMLALGRQKGGASSCAVACDIEGRLPFLDDSFDLVLCWRFLHHLPSRELVAAVLEELARISREWVVISFFHRVSLHNFSRRLSAWFSGQESCRFASTLKDLEAAGRKAGLRVALKAAQAPFLRDLWAVAFAKESVGKSGIPEAGDASGTR